MGQSGGWHWHEVGKETEHTDTLYELQVKAHFLPCSSAGLELPSLPPEASVPTPGKIRRYHSVPIHCVRSV